MTRWLALVSLAACGGSAGKLVNERKDVAAFVTEKQPLLVSTADGLVRIALDGSGRETLASAAYGFLAMTLDGRMLALTDKDTNLYILDTKATPREPRRVKELDGRTGPVAVRPDGGLVASTRHADFNEPQRNWSRSEDDSVYLVDPRTLAVEIIPKTRDELVISLWWTADGSALMLGMSNFDTVRLDLATRQRNVVPSETRPMRGLGSRSCARTGDKLEMSKQGDEGVEIVTSTGKRRRLLVIEGRSRGFHDHLSTIEDPVFTPSCKYVVFGFGRAIWVADAATGTIGQLLAGGDVRVLAE